MSPLGTISIVIFLIFSVLILISAVRSSIPRKIGFRNVRRRLGNTIMVVFGSMVGAALISGSLVLSDSLDKTFLNMVEENLGEMDVIVSTSPKKMINTPFAYITKDEYAQIEKKLMSDPNKIDGVMAGHYFQTAPSKLDANGKPTLNIYMIDTYALDFAQYSKFGQNPIKVNPPSAPNNVYVSDTLAKKLDLKEGDIFVSHLRGKIQI